MNTGIWQWAESLAPVPAEHRLSLGEGGTPLVPSRSIGPKAGLTRLFFKLESTNPTGSYKDRFAAAAISHMRAEGKTECLATSSGNTGAALAAYCAAAGLRCRIAVVETAPAGKLRQMLAYGAEILRVRGFGLDPDVTRQTFTTLQQLGTAPHRALQISAYAFSPAGMSGVESLGWELATPGAGSFDHVFCPAGGGGLCLAVARGLAGAVRHGNIVRSPAVHCVQPEGNATIAAPLRSGATVGQAVNCTSRISGLQVPNVLDGNAVIHACRANGGTGQLVRDEVVWELQARLSLEEGLFVEPASAVALAGALQAAANGEIQPDTSIVCLLTGSGFKDEASLGRWVREDACPCVEPEELKRL